MGSKGRVLLVCAALTWGCGAADGGGGEDGENNGGGGGVACNLITDQSTCATTAGCSTVSGPELNEEEACFEAVMYLYCVSEGSCEGSVGYSIRDSDGACFMTSSKCDAPAGWESYAEGETDCTITALGNAMSCP